MKYLVTGGAGFIGSHLVDELVAKGDEVLVLDNLSTGKKSNLNPRAKFYKKDIRDYKSIKPLFAGVGGVFHLAALPQVQLSIEDPIKTNEINVTGTLNVLAAVKNAGIKRLVYSASSAVYGDATAAPIHESSKLLPVSPYGLQKYIGEEYVRLFSFLYGLEAVSLRYFNVYGPRMADKGAYLTVIKVFLKQKVAGESLTITGDGEQTRDFIHVRDVVRANILAMENRGVGRGEVINIGFGKSYSVNQIADLIGGVKKYISPRIEPKHTLADNSLAKKLLGWEPKVKLRDGLRELLS